MLAVANRVNCVTCSHTYYITMIQTCKRNDNTTSICVFSSVMFYWVRIRQNAKYFFCVLYHIYKMWSGLNGFNLWISYRGNSNLQLFICNLEEFSIVLDFNLPCITDASIKTCSSKLQSVVTSKVGQS